MKQNYLQALLSAFLLWLAWPPIPYSSPILWVAFVPLLLAIEDIIRNDHFSKKGKKVFLTAGLTAFVWNTSCIYWVYNAMAAVMPWYMASIIALIPFGLAALLMSLAFYLYYQLRKKRSFVISSISLIGFWMSYEYLHQSWDLAFPWMTLGNGFANFHQLIQWYEYTGVYGGTLWIWLINLLVFSIYLRRKDFPQASAKKLYILLGSLILVPITFSVLRYMRYEEHLNPAQVVVVQPNIDPYGKFGYISPAQQLQTLLALSKTVAAANTEFFIWPETALSNRGGLDEDFFRETPIYSQLLQFLDAYKNASILSGIESYKRYKDQRTVSARPYGNAFMDSFNAAVLVDNSTKLQFYHKSKLVPGVEQTPFGNAIDFLKPAFEAFGGSTGGYGKQEDPTVFYSQSGIGAAPVICYESIWGDYVRQYVQKGAQFIAIITNDGWWGNTSGKDQHLAYAQLRAIENRRWVARSANTGISAIINQRGDIVQQTQWWEPSAFAQEINLNEEISCYTAWGDLLAYLGLILAAAGAILILIPQKKDTGITL